MQLGYQYLLAVRLVLANCWDQQGALFFLAYTLLSIFKGSKKSFFSYAWRSLVITIPVVYLFGVAGFMIVTKTELWAALPVVMFPFIPGDIVKCLVASWLATKVKI